MALTIGSLAVRERLPQENLCPEAISLLDACEGLRRHGSQGEYINCLNGNWLLDTLVRRVVRDLRYSTLLKLSLLTWHFDASFHLPSEGLIGFLRQPRVGSDAVWRILHDQYQRNAGETIPFQDFRQSFDDFLSTIPVWDSN